MHSINQQRSQQREADAVPSLIPNSVISQTAATCWGHQIHLGLFIDPKGPTFAPQLLDQSQNQKHECRTRHFKIFTHTNTHTHMSTASDASHCVYVQLLTQVCCSIAAKCLMHTVCNSLPAYVQQSLFKKVIIQNKIRFLFAPDPHIFQGHVQLSFSKRKKNFLYIILHSVTFLCILLNIIAHYILFCLLLDWRTALQFF